MAVIGLGRHGMQGDAGLGLTLHQHPVDGRPAPVGGKEGAVEVVGALLGQVQVPLVDHFPEVEAEEEVGGHGGDGLVDPVAVEVLFHVHGDAVLLRQRRGGREPGLIGALRVGVQGLHVDARLQEPGQGLVADGGIGANDGCGHGRASGGRPF